MGDWVKKLNNLAEEATSEGELKLAGIFFTLVGAYLMDDLEPIKDYCMRFSEKMIKILEQQRENGE